VNRATTAREALVAELIGDVAQLLDRVETLTPTINAARHALTDAARNLASSVGPMQAHMAALADHTKTKAVEHIVRRTNLIAAQTLQEQTRAMTESARAIINSEVGPPLRQLAATVKDVVERAHRPWDAWLTHAATAIVSGICSAGLVVHFLGR
jgi:ubiquinone biosynthesis protein UbiJ